MMTLLAGTTRTQRTNLMRKLPQSCTLQKEYTRVLATRSPQTAASPLDLPSEAPRGTFRIENSKEIKSRYKVTRVPLTSGQVTLCRAAAVPTRYHRQFRGFLHTFSSDDVLVVQPAIAIYLPAVVVTWVGGPLLESLCVKNPDDCGARIPFPLKRPQSRE